MNRFADAIDLIFNPYRVYTPASVRRRRIACRAMQWLGTFALLTGFVLVVRHLARVGGVNAVYYTVGAMLALAPLEWAVLFGSAALADTLLRRRS